MATQIVGNVNNATAAEVEINSKAQRVVLRADDPGSLGWYRLAATNGTTAMAAGLAAAAEIFQWRNGNASNLIILRKIEFSAGNSATAFTAGAVTFNLFRATSFSANGTGGATFLPGTGNKLRTSFGSSLMTAGNNSDIRCATTAALTAGTKTNDAVALASFQGAIIATAGTPITPGKVVFLEQRGWEYPLTFAQNEGFSIQATVPATGTWFFEVTVLWEELASY
jgi:hypothetical protein